MNQAIPSAGAQQDEKQVSQPHEQLQEQPAGQPSVGTQLAGQREVRGWTVEQVASQLNLAPRQIQALEQDNYAALPGMASVRGFIRAYAKLLKMDAEPLIAALASELAAPPIEPLQSRRPLTAPFSDAKNLPPLGNRAPVPMHVVGGIAAIVVLAGVFAAYQFGLIEVPVMPAGPSTTSAVSAPAEQMPVASVVANAEIGAGASATAAPASDVNTPPVANAAPAATAQAPVVSEQPVQQVPAASGKNTLVLKMNEESWIEIRRAGEAAPGTSSVLLSRLEKAGTTEIFEVTEPVAIVVGNAGGVEATLRGEPVDLKASAKSNVARLTLK